MAAALFPVTECGQVPAQVGLIQGKGQEPACWKGQEQGQEKGQEQSQEQEGAGAGAGRRGVSRPRTQICHSVSTEAWHTVGNDTDLPCSIPVYCSVVQCIVVHYNALQFSALQCIAVQCSAE